MPLSPPVSRTHIHTRSIKFSGYEREDGLFDIEAHMTDTKTYEFENLWRGKVQVGEALHEMLLRVTIDDQFLIHDVEAVTDHSPFAMCPDIAPNYKDLKGLRMAAGWRQAVRARVGGTNGCTHLTELLYPLATVAFQTIKPLQNHRRRQVDSDGSASAGKPFVLNTCHAWAEDSPVVKQNAPAWYQAKQAAAEE
jgi:hypothetical protein